MTLGRRNSFMGRTALCLALLVSAILAHAHGDEDHSDSTQTGSPAIISATADSTAPDWDSVYAVIQADYLGVRPIFEQGCYDCHSTRTDFPWYYKLPLVKGLIDGDIHEARGHLDFTDGFPFKGHANPADDLRGIALQLESGGMPPPLYRMMHWNAKPTAAERDSVIAWIGRSLRVLAAHGQYPYGRPDLVPAEDE